MERDYVKELKENTLYRFLLRNNGCRIYWPSKDGDELRYTFTSSSYSVYFRRPNGTYQRYDMNSEFNSKAILSDILKITRIEKQFEDKWLPVWTLADGFIETDFHNFAYIQERYYTFNELEQIITEIKSLKKTVANLKVY